MGHITTAEFDKVPYVENVPTDGRAIVLQSFYDESEDDWHLYLEVQPGTLGRIAGGEPVIGGYYASVPADATQDIHFPLGSFVAQHLSYPNIVAALGTLQSDVFQFCCVLEKYEMIVGRRGEEVSVVAAMLQSELEHLLTLIRSFYDLLQVFSKRATALIRPTTDRSTRLVDDLPGSFAKLVLDGERPRAATELVERHRLPLPIAEFYAREAPWFAKLRRLRDAIVHHGKSVPTIFELDQGAAVSIDEDPWATLDVWGTPLVIEGRFGSVRGLFAVLIDRTLRVANDYARAFAGCIAVPSAISPGLEIYLRHPLGARIVTLPAVLDSPWEGLATADD